MIRYKDKLEEKNVISEIEAIVKDHSMGVLKFDDGKQMEVDVQTANMLLTVLKALKDPKMKDKFEKMVNKDKSSFMKVVDFGWSMVK